MKPRIADMITIASRLTNIPESEIKGPKRYQAYCAIRAAIYLVAREWEYSWPFIGRQVGGRDHSTAIYGVQGTGKFSKAMQDFDGFLETLGRYADELPPFVSETTWQPPEFFSVLLSDRHLRNLESKVEAPQFEEGWSGFKLPPVATPRRWTKPPMEMAA